MEGLKVVLDQAADEWLGCYEAHRKFIAATKNSPESLPETREVRLVC